MHGQTDCTIMATNCERAGHSPVWGQAECSDSPRPLDAGSPLHGERLEDSSQPPAGERGNAGREKDNVEGVCASGGRHPCHKGEPCEKERLARMGLQAGVGRQSLRPQEQTGVVSTPKPNGAVSVGNVMQLLEHQAYCCALTGRSLTPQTAALDHVMPIRRGGEHVIENAQVLHKDVNRAKGSLTAEEFVQLCREVVRCCGQPSEKEGNCHAC